MRTRPVITSSLGSPTIKRVGRWIYHVKLQMEDKHPWLRDSIVGGPSTPLEDGLELFLPRAEGDYPDEGDLLHITGLPAVDDVWSAQLIAGTRCALEYFVYANL